MLHAKDILRLKFHNHLSLREIARTCGLPASTVGDCLQRAQAAKLTWPLPEDIADSELMARLMDSACAPPNCPPGKPLPDWPTIHQELRRKAVTLQLLWQEYRQVEPEGYGYSRFCELYERSAGVLDPALRQAHEPLIRALPCTSGFVGWN